MSKRNRDRLRERARAYTSGANKERWLAVPLEHNCDRTDYLATDKYLTQHRKRGQKPCGFARESARLYQQKRKRGEEGRKQKRTEVPSPDRKVGKYDHLPHKVYLVQVKKTRFYYYGITHRKLHKRLENHYDGTGSKRLGKMVDEGHRLSINLITVCKNRERARGVEIHYIEDTPGRDPQYCLNEAHSGGRNR